MTTPPDWNAADKAYQRHHTTYATCRAAGMAPGLRERCPEGAALWRRIPTGRDAAAFSVAQPEEQEDTMTTTNAASVAAEAIVLLRLFQNNVYPRRPGADEPEDRALWDRVEAACAALASPGAVAAPAPIERPARQPEGLQEAEIIKACEAAGMKWCEPDGEEGGFPGAFDMPDIPSMQRLFSSFGKPISFVCESCFGKGVEGDADDYGRTIDVACGDCKGTGRLSSPKLPWPWKTQAEVLADAIEHIDGQERLKSALRILASTTVHEAKGAVAAEPTGWMPIETAPKDGTEVLLRSARGRIADGAWGQPDGWANPNCWVWPYINQEPTHWQPLPPAPKE